MIQKVYEIYRAICSSHAATPESRKTWIIFPKEDLKIKELERKTMRDLSICIALTYNFISLFQVVDATDKLSPALLTSLLSDCTALQVASLQCLLSLSRSVQQLRSMFQNVSLWQRILDMLQTSHSDDVLSTASSVLCNLLLDFSPCKEVSNSIFCFGHFGKGS